MGTGDESYSVFRYFRGKHAGPVVLMFEQGWSAFKPIRFIQIQARIGNRTDDLIKTREQPKLGEHLKTVADAKDWMFLLYEGFELFLQLAFHPCRKNRSCSDVITSGEPTRDHQTLIVKEVTELVFITVNSQELFQVDEFRAST